MLTLALLLSPGGVWGLEVPEELQFIFRRDIYMPPSEEKTWERQAAEMPGITDRLCNLLWACYNDLDHAPGNGFENVLAALKLRGDIPPEQLKKITDEIRRLASLGMDKAQEHGVENMLYGGVGILDRYPSAEHEDLVLLLLKSDDIFLQMNAAMTLGKIGTNRSIDPMRKFIDPFRPDPNHIAKPGEWPANQRMLAVYEAEKLILDRVARGVAPGVDSPSVNASDRKQKSKLPTVAQSKAETSTTTPWLVWLLVIIAAAIGAAWLLLRKSKP